MMTGSEFVGLLLFLGFCYGAYRYYLYREAKKAIPRKPQPKPKLPIDENDRR